MNKWTSPFGTILLPGQLDEWHRDEDSWRTIQAWLFVIEASFANLQVSEERNVYMDFLQNYIPMEAKWLPHPSLKVAVI